MHNTRTCQKTTDFFTFVGSKDDKSCHIAPEKHVYARYKHTKWLRYALNDGDSESEKNISIEEKVGNF